MAQPPFSAASRNTHRRDRLRLEPLEDRRMLATFTVTTELDVVDPEDGLTSLREAIDSANTTTGPDDIVFDFGHDRPAVILLEDGHLEITEAVTINGDGPEWLTIDAQHQSGIFAFRAETGDFTISGMTVTNGTGELGGGIFASGNATVIVNSSTISANSAIAGGGIAAVDNAAVVVNSSTISGNSADFPTGPGGGGIYAKGDVTVSSSTISGNSGEIGGGITAFGNGSVSVMGSTISGNSGGGIHSRGNVSVSSSTISGNSGSGWGGGGIYAYSGDPNTNLTLTIESSILAGNTEHGEACDLDEACDLYFPRATLSVQHSLIGTNFDTHLAEAPVGSPDANGNLIGGPINGIINPLLAPLADNGGTTQTHALLPGSPAINAGDPSAVAGVDGVPLYDQRGEGFDRVAGGRIDMGAFEVQPLRADFDKDGDVDGADFLVWQTNFFTPTGATPNDGDADGDGDVDGEDFLIWQLEFAGGSGAGSEGDAAPLTSRPQRPANLDRFDATLSRGRSEIATSPKVRDEALEQVQFRRHGSPGAGRQGR